MSVTIKLSELKAERAKMPAGFSPSAMMAPDPEYNLDNELAYIRGTDATHNAADALIDAVEAALEYYAASKAMGEADSALDNAAPEDHAMSDALDAAAKRYFDAGYRLAAAISRFEP